MKSTTVVPSTRRRVALAGTVIDGGSGKPLAGVDVVMSKMPVALSKRLKLYQIRY